MNWNYKIINSVNNKSSPRPEKTLKKSIIIAATTLSIRPDIELPA